MPRLKSKPDLIVFSKGKPDDTATSNWIKGSSCRVLYVLSEGDDRESYERSTGCKNVIAVGCPNLPSKRQWAMDRFTSKSNKWMKFCEDNIRFVTAVSHDRYGDSMIDKTTRSMYHDRRITVDETLDLMNSDIVIADRIGAYYGGFASNDNHFFRKKKYRTVAFVWSKLAYCKSGGPRWPSYLTEKDDYGFTAECLKYSGRVLVNNFVYAWPRAYEGFGGSPKLEDRIEPRLRSVEEMMRRFSGLFRIRDRKGREKGTEIQLTMYSESQIDKWRAT